MIKKILLISTLLSSLLKESTLKACCGPLVVSEFVSNALFVSNAFILLAPTSMLRWSNTKWTDPYLHDKKTPTFYPLSTLEFNTLCGLIGTVALIKTKLDYNLRYKIKPNALAIKFLYGGSASGFALLAHGYFEARKYRIEHS